MFSNSKVCASSAANIFRRNRLANCGRLFSTSSSTSSSSLKNLSAKLAAYKILPRRSTASIQLVNDSHPKYAPIRITAELVNAYDDSNEMVDNDRDEEDHEIESMTKDDVNSIDSDGRNDVSSGGINDEQEPPVLSMTICLKCGGHDVSIKCEGPAMDTNYTSNRENFENVDDDHDISDDLEDAEDDRFAPVSIAVSADGNSPDLDNEKTVCVFPEDLSSEEQDNLESLIEEIGIDEETVEEITEMLMKLEDSVVQEQKDLVSRVLKSLK